MCLAVPGRIVSIAEDDAASESDALLMRNGKVSFGGVVKEVNLAFVPEAQIGDYVIVHVGIALNRVDEAEAQQTFAYLKMIDELELPPDPELAR